MNRAGVPDHFTMSFLPFEQDLNIIYSPLKPSFPRSSSLPSASCSEAVRTLVRSLDLDRQSPDVKNPEKQLDPVQLKIQTTVASRELKDEEEEEDKDTAWIRRLSGWMSWCCELPSLHNSNGILVSRHRPSIVTLCVYACVMRPLPCSFPADLYGYGYLNSSQDDDCSSSSSAHDAVLDCKLAFGLPEPHSQSHREPQPSVVLPGLLDHHASKEEDDEEIIQTPEQYYSALLSLQRADPSVLGNDTRVVPRIFRGLQDIVERLVTDGGDASFVEAAKCLEAFRSACGEMAVKAADTSTPALASSISLLQQQFNSFLESLKEKYQTGFKRGFWQALQTLRVSIISPDSHQVQVWSARAQGMNY